MIFFFFFFQAEDGIRDYKVTGVQTCALPISSDMTASFTWITLFPWSEEIARMKHLIWATCERCGSAPRRNIRRRARTRSKTPFDNASDYWNVAVQPNPAYS